MAAPIAKILYYEVVAIEILQLANNGCLIKVKRLNNIFEQYE
jgi:hypothetical protein